jgi:predicted nucleotidyltransferase component of viral defense system
MNGSAETEALIIRLINLFADAFPAQAILKGGMELRLLNCPRFTNDIDYIFIPFTSKKDVVGPVMEVLRSQPGVTVEQTTHSTCVRIIVATVGARVQVELNVAKSCKSQELTTAELSRMYNMQGRIVRAMSLDVALAHKLAAWQERRLARDLYDVYFMRERLLVSPDRETLSFRLSKVNYQNTRFKGPKSMTLTEFSTHLRQYAGTIDQPSLRDELEDLLDERELVALDLKIRSALIGIAEEIEIPMV